jgi:hypothetical protein
MTKIRSTSFREFNTIVEKKMDAPNPAAVMSSSIADSRRRSLFSHFIQGFGFESSPRFF